jgi:hypothetical protein
MSGVSTVCENETYVEVDVYHVHVGLVGYVGLLRASDTH